MKNIKAFGNKASNENLQVLEISRRNTSPDDVNIKILYCGICHSDLHILKNEWGFSQYPVIPGHEIIGEVIEVGSNVSKFKVGDIVGVGCIVDSCRECEHCKNHLEQYCPEWTIVFNSFNKRHNEKTHGGFSQTIVTDQNYVLHIPKTLPLDKAAPLLCAGITTYSPLKHWNAGPGKRVGVIGVGGLGHMAIKLANAFKSQVVAFTTSESKFKEAQKLGAHECVLSTDKESMKNVEKLDLIIDTVSNKHDINSYLDLLKVDGSLVLVGLPAEPLSISSFSVINGRKSFSGSNIGGIKETQEMLDFCGKHNITADIELIKINQVNDALIRLEKGDIKYRFVIDMSSL